MCCEVKKMGIFSFLFPLLTAETMPCHVLDGAQEMRKNVIERERIHSLTHQHVCSSDVRIRDMLV